MYRWFIAYKYVLSRITTFAALVVVAVSVALLIIILSVMEGFRSELIHRIHGTSADIKVASTRYIDMKEPDRVASIVARVPGVRATAVYVETLALYRVIDSLWVSQDFEQRFLRVVDVDREIEVGDLAKYVENTGFAALPKDPRELFSKEWNEVMLWKVMRQPPPAKPLPPVILGKEAVRRHVRPGDKVEITVYSPTTQQPYTAQFQVAGYFKTGLYPQDSQGILMDRTAARELFHLETPDGRELASGVRVGVDSAYTGEESLQQLRLEIEKALDAAQVPFVRVLTWRDEQASLVIAVRVEKSLMSIIVGMIVLFSGFMIFIILTVQVVDKTRDLGVLQSMGATSGGIASIYCTMGLSLCLVGTLIGTIYGVGIALGVNTIQRWIKLLTGLEVFPQHVYYLDKIPVRFQPVDLVSIIVPTVLAGLLASLIPAWRAGRQDPARSLRYE